jgi:hypothetical protein
MYPYGLLREEFLVSTFLRLRSPGRAVEYLVNSVDIVHTGIMSHYKMITHSGPLYADAASLIGARYSATMTLVVSFLAFKFQSDIQDIGSCCRRFGGSDTVHTTASFIRKHYPVNSASP